ncbi:polycomb group protein Psc-like [Zerene cesonia]|uniref:polycomb group protein Psc-like n=1 Tax=Zerene cesonia TaxID=33412 RepID=UPI0018E4F369|nr:polycomb group protein Psc-like [Zerene cesonia]
MVTSNKQTEKKVVKMTAQINNAVAPHRTLLGEVNEHITCPLCRGYYIDATTIVECLHSFCRSCIIKHLQVKKYCPVCEMMINSAKPNIKLDKALQDIVYKLVPGLFQKEMERRQQFYSSRPGPAASATPEQRGEDTERIIFSPEDVISFSLEYSDVTDTDSISSKSSDSNESQSTSTTARRYLQCPAVVNISHLKKFLSMKFDIDSTQFAIDILYKRVPLPDYYTLMDIAYIYNWKRNEPMRFFYQIIDYVAIRNRLFDLNRKGSQLHDKKAIPAVAEDTHANSPITNTNDLASEASSGADSPMLDENNARKSNDTSKKCNNYTEHHKANQEASSNQRSNSPVKKNDDEDEKSQFLNSFELTAKNSSASSKTSPTKNLSDNAATENKITTTNTLKNEDSLKRKFQIGNNLPEMKKVKIEIEKAKIPVSQNVSSSNTNLKTIGINDKNLKNTEQSKTVDNSPKGTQSGSSIVNSTMTSKDSKQSANLPKQADGVGQKRTIADTSNNLTPKRKPELMSTSPSLQKTVSPLKIQLSKTDSPSLINNKSNETPKGVSKKIPDLKPSTTGAAATSKSHISGKLRMDLLANNSDPTIDRSKILSQVKTSVPTSGQNTGDNLKSLFDSCKINIPSSLSITLTDQKSPSDLPISEQKKNIINKNLMNSSNNSNHKAPSPPVHNYIEIKKLPDTDTKKTTKTESVSDTKPNIQKSDNTAMTPKLNKSSETSAKGPIPNLKPIADTKLAKQTGNSSAPITFQQTFEQQLQSLQTDTKVKVPKNKAQVPKLVPATPKAFSAANKLNNVNSKVPTGVSSGENKTTAALDLSTPHSIQSQLGPQQTKAFETMQSIANLAKKQNLPPKSIPLTLSQDMFPTVSRRPITTSSTLRIPSGNNNTHVKLEKPPANMSQLSSRQEMPKQISAHKSLNQIQATVSNIPSPNYQGAQPSNTSTQPSPQSQTRSPSSSPKLVIAEEKQTSSASSDQNQSNTPLHPQLSNMFAPRCESPKDSHSHTKPGLKPMKPLIPTSKLSSIRQPITPSLNTNTAMSSQADYLSHAIFRHQMEMQSAWLKAQRQYDILKNMPNMAIPSQNEFNNKDKQ